MSQPDIFFPVPSPSPNRIVEYRVTEDDAAQVRARRAGGPGNEVAAGDVFPAVIVRVWAEGPDAPCNLQVLLDGPDTLWVTSRHRGDDDGTWAWPRRTT